MPLEHASLRVYPPLKLTRGGGAGFFGSVSGLWQSEIGRIFSLDFLSNNAEICSAKWANWNKVRLCLGPPSE